MSFATLVFISYLAWSQDGLQDLHSPARDCSQAPQWKRPVLTAGPSGIPLTPAFLISICMEYLFQSPYFQSVYASRSEMEREGSHTLPSAVPRATGRYCTIPELNSSCLRPGLLCLCPCTRPSSALVNTPVLPAVKPRLYLLTVVVIPCWTLEIPGKPLKNLQHQESGLAIQWLGLHTFTADGASSILLVRELTSLQAKWCD